ncbi:MAG: hypothetical protein HRT87_01545 [Legionellales bacterium]|nr:hypothetical protein [Legionellales bacterium]
MARIKLICESVIFYSDYDEELFYLWIKKIDSIVNCYGEGTIEYLCLDSYIIPDDDLRELLSLFYKYDINMNQLSIFVNENNEEWFKNNTESFWHGKVFVTETKL